ncbi:MAG: class I SAM-dependent RNA methyltransferase, partial [Lachnospiraceae bacterium]|nr:class I SAM-dependent RNA methyltransferase [Lachnospiraceae bacterium]
MKKGQIYEGVIESVEFPNKAVIPYMDQTADGENIEVKVSAKGGIPGQRVSFAVKKARRENCKGRILEVLEKSPLETEKPVCPKFGLCGGCNYQTLPYEKQLELKKNQVLRLLDTAMERFYGMEEAGRHSGALSREKAVYGDGLAGKEFREKRNLEHDYIYDGLLASHAVTAYRNKLEFSFGDEKMDGPLTLGLHKKGSFHDILDADSCQIVHEDFRQVLVCVRDFCREKEIPFYRKNSHEGILRHLLVRRSVATGEILAALVVSSQRLPEWEGKSDVEVWEELTERLIRWQKAGKEDEKTDDDKEAGEETNPKERLAGFLLIINDSLGDVVQSDRMEILYGRDFIVEEILGLKFKITPFSFFQTNSKGAEVLYRRARDYILGNT